jgi:hypothetical protein
MTLTPVQESALFSAAEGGMMSHRSTTGIGRHRRPVAWSGWGGYFGRGTINALRRRGLLRGVCGRWVFHLTPEGLMAASRVAAGRGDPYRAALWLRLSAFR